MPQSNKFIVYFSILSEMAYYFKAGLAHVLHTKAYNVIGSLEVQEKTLEEILSNITTILVM